MLGITKFILLIAVVLSTETCTATTMTPLQSVILQTLTSAGASRVSERIQQDSARLASATNQMNDKIAYCNGIAETYQQNCVNCVKRKCEDKASSCGKELTFSGVINSITDFGSNVINSITDIGGNVIDTITDTGKKIIDGIKKITGWGRRRRTVRAEPSCSEFNNAENAAQACLKYQDYCSACSYDPHQHCSGYTNVKNEYDRVVRETQWLHKIGQTTTYGVTAVSYDQSSWDPNTLGYRTVSVTVNVFGRQTSFYMSQVNPFEADKTGPIIADRAIEWFKTSALQN